MCHAPAPQQDAPVHPLHIRLRFPSVLPSVPFSNLSGKGVLFLCTSLCQGKSFCTGSVLALNRFLHRCDVVKSAPRTSHKVEEHSEKWAEIETEGQDAAGEGVPSFTHVPYLALWRPHDSSGSHSRIAPPLHWRSERSSRIIRQG